MICTPFQSDLVADDDDMVTIPRKEYERLVQMKYQKDSRLAAERMKNGEDNRFPDAVIRQLVAGIIPVRVFRNHRKMTMVTLAKLTSVSIPYICEIETGKKPGGLNTMKKIAEALDVRIDDLV